MVNVGKYTIHGRYGEVFAQICPECLKQGFFLTVDVFSTHFLWQEPR